MKKIGLLSLMMSLLILLAACGGATPAPSNQSSFVEILAISSPDANTVLITFDSKMTESANFAANYEISRTTSDQQITRLTVTDAVLNEDETQVSLSTLTQSQVSYNVKVNNVQSKAGQAVGNSQDNTFIGKQASGESADSDGDGLTDAEEQQGWQVIIFNGEREIERYRVTSDPLNPNSDGDELNDFEEAQASLDPTKNDTDVDGLEDHIEVNVFKSKGFDKDTDKDGLNDGDEVNKYRTSPKLSDTDADQLDDSYEVNTANRNPLIADLPEPQITVDNLSLALNVTLTETNSNETTFMKSENIEKTLTNGSSNSVGTTDIQTDEWFATVGASVEATAGMEGPVPNGQVSVGFSAEGGLSGSSTLSVDESSTKEVQESYLQATTTDEEIRVGSSVEKTIDQGYISALVKIENRSDISFTIEKLQILVLIQDPNIPTKFSHEATLTFKSESDFDFFSEAVGPKASTREFVFEDANAFPNVVENLMKNPSSVIFRVSKYDLRDEEGRNFQYVEQDLNDSTAKLYIDYGTEGPYFERNRIATFDADNNSGSLTLATALENILGLTHYDEDTTASQSLSKQERETSYSTKIIDIQGKQVETLWRVRNVARDNVQGALKEWLVIGKNGVDKTINAREIILKAGSEATLSFAQDLDEDGVVARIEAQRGSSDTNSDSDGDGLTDREEIYGGFEIEVTTDVGENARERNVTVFSHPGRADSDNDGLSDAEEKRLGTNPRNADTDGDGIFDKKEVDGGYTITVEGKTVPVNKNASLGYATDPNDADTDNDSAKDGDELLYPSNPQIDDLDRFADTDGDGLSNGQERNGWEVTVEYFTQVTETITVKSDESKKDSDGDGLDDKSEKEKGTHPRRADTDRDGLNDDEDPYPLDADKDNDGLGDREEINGWNVFVDGNLIGKKTSDPTKTDSDEDGLIDEREFSLKTDPRNKDTDGDGVNDKRESDRIQDSNPHNNTSPTTKDQVITIKYTQIDITIGCDDFFQGWSGQWSWRLGAWINGSYRNNSQPFLAQVAADNTSFTLLNNTRFRIIGTNPLQFVKKYTEEFSLDGEVWEDDGHKDPSSINKFNQYERQSETLFGKGSVTGKRVSIQGGGACKSTVHATIEVNQDFN